MRSKSDSDVIYFYTCILKAMIIYERFFFPSINELLKHRVDYIWIVKNFINDFQKRLLFIFNIIGPLCDICYEIFAQDFLCLNKKEKITNIGSMYITSPK